MLFEEIVLSTEKTEGLRKLAVELRDDFNDAATKLDAHTRNVNIARVTGGSAALAGGVTAIIGFALVPVTLGLSAVVAGITGAAIAAAGGITAGGASVAQIFIDRFRLKPLVAEWTKFNELVGRELVGRELREKDPDSYRRMRDELRARLGEDEGRAEG
ncbi:hypothetical protein ACOMHN_030257 [Nucella lapillus]